MTAEAQKRIFIIGPMTKDAADPKGLEWAQHIPNIAKALNQTLARLRNKRGPSLDDYLVVQPPFRPGSITREVFPEIMHCDIAVADLSSGSPNVLYELAMLHANGVPVILLNFKAPGLRKDVFYLNQQNVLEVDNFDVATLSEALAGGSFDAEESSQVGQLEHVLSAGADPKYYDPITEHFGGVAMVNVAAAAGIATGQHYNFLKWVLEDGGIFSDPDVGVDRIILLRPDRIQQVDEIKRELTQRFGITKANADGTSTRDLPSILYQFKGHSRKTFLYKIGRYIVDYPTPISSLSVSRQYIEMRKYVKRQSQGLEEAQLRRFERRLIHIYFNTLEDLATSTHNTCDWTRVLVRSLPEAIQLLEAEKPDSAPA